MSAWEPFFVTVPIAIYVGYHIDRLSRALAKAETRIHELNAKIDGVNATRLLDRELHDQDIEEIREKLER